MAEKKAESLLEEPSSMGLAKLEESEKKVLKAFLEVLKQKELLRNEGDEKPVIQVSQEQAPEIPILKGLSDVDFIELEEKYANYKAACEKLHLRAKTEEFCLVDNDDSRIRTSFRVGVLGQRIDDPDTITAEQVQKEIKRAKELFPEQRANQVLNTLTRYLKEVNAYDMRVDNVTRRVGKLKAHILIHLRKFGSQDLWEIPKSRTRYDEHKQFRIGLIKRIIPILEPHELRKDMQSSLQLDRDLYSNHIAFLKRFSERAEAFDKVYRIQSNYTSTKDKVNGDKEQIKQGNKKAKAATEVKAKEAQQIFKHATCLYCRQKGHYLLRKSKNKEGTYVQNCPEKIPADKFEGLKARELEIIKKKRKAYKERTRAQNSGVPQSANKVDGESVASDRSLERLETNMSHIVGALRSAGIIKKPKKKKKQANSTTDLTSDWYGGDSSSSDSE